MNWEEICEAIDRINDCNEGLQLEADAVIYELLLDYSEVATVLKFLKPVKCYYEGVLCWMDSISWEEDENGELEDIAFDLHYDYSEEKEEDIPYGNVRFDRIKLMNALKQTIDYVSN